MQIAILAPDSARAAWMCQLLAPLRHACHPLHTVTAMLQRMDEAGCDLLILAPQNPDDSVALLRAARNRQPALPVLLVAGGDAEDDVVAAIAAGVDDYIIEPLRHGEFRMRVRALLRHAYPEQGVAEQICIGPYRFDHQALQVVVAGISVALTQKEFDLALLFFRHLGRPLSRAFIRETIWIREADVPSRTIDTHVSRVRSKLRLRPENGFRLLPVYSFGYRLEQVSKGN